MSYRDCKAHQFKPKSHSRHPHRNTARIGVSTCRYCGPARAAIVITGVYRRRSRESETGQALKMEEKSHSPRIGGSWEWEEARKQIPRSFQKPHGTADTTILGQRRPAGASGLQNQEDYNFILFEVSVEDTPAQGGSLRLCCPHPYRETSRASFVRAQLSLLRLNWKRRQK